MKTKRDDNGVVQLTDAEKAKAAKDGAIEAAQEAGKESYAYATDGVQLGEPAANSYHGSDEIMLWAHLIDLGVTAFQQAVSKTEGDGVIPDEKVAGLLKLERNGKNRTPYVKALCDRLGIDDPRSVADGGPDFTNDITALSTL